LAVLGRAPTPAQGRALTLRQIRAALSAGGRRRNLAARAGEIADGLRVDALAAPEPVTAAFAATTRSAVAVIAELNAQIAALAEQLADHFEQHPDAAIYRSQPGLGVVLGARVLSEFGDDPERYADAKCRRNYAGTSPITRASSNRSVALARFIRNRRLADAIDQWAFCSLTTSPGARAYYDLHRGNGDSHHKALRALMLYWMLYRSSVVPRVLSVWGLIGAAVLLVGVLLVLFGVASESVVVQAIVNAPIALNELALAVWLLAKGFTGPSVSTPARDVDLSRAR
jgi:hypothetical protein